jgi:hypothetical protein
MATITMMTMVTTTRGQTPGRGLVTSLMDNCIAALRDIYVDDCSLIAAPWRGLAAEMPLVCAFKVRLVRLLMDHCNGAEIGSSMERQTLPMAIR